MSTVRLNIDHDAELYPCLVAEQIIDPQSLSPYVEVPAEVWRRSERARAELRAAENALCDAARDVPTVRPGEDPEVDR